MTENELYCKQIEKTYPEFVTKEQFYKIAHISKATAQWLLQSKLVPCYDSGKKTHRYTIRTKNIIAYLKERAKNPHKYDIPRGLRSVSGDMSRTGYAYRNYFIKMDAEHRLLFRKHLEKAFEKHNDLII